MYETEFKELNHHLLETVSGGINPATDFEIDTKIRAECEKTKKAFVLIDIRRKNSNMSAIENHIAAKSYRERMGPAIEAIAIVDSTEFKDKSNMFEITATNRGATVKFFEEIEDAETWLDSLLA